MSELMTDKLILDGLVESLEQHEAERTLESLRSGSPFDAGVVEGISSAIERLDSARTGADLQAIVQDLSSVSQLALQEDDYDYYAKGIAAGVSHVAAIVRDELASTPERDY